MNKTALGLALVASMGVMAESAFAAPPGLTPVAPVAIEPAPSEDETPPLSGGRLVGEFFLGGLVGGVGTVAGAYVGYSLEMSGGCSGEWCGVGGLIFGGIVGYTLSAPLGVYMVGSADNQTGSLGWTYGGSLLGGLAGIGLAATGSEGGAVLGLAAPIIGAMIGFNATRRYERESRPQPRWTPTASVSSEQSTLGIAGRF